MTHRTLGRDNGRDRRGLSSAGLPVGGTSAQRRGAAEAPLRADVHALGELLGSTLRAQHGEAFFQRLEQVRQLARRRRSEVPAGSTSGSKAERDAARPSDGGQLEALLEGLPL